MSTFEAIGFPKGNGFSLFALFGAITCGTPIAIEEVIVVTGGVAPTATVESVGLLLKFVFMRRVDRSSPPDALRFLGDLLFRRILIKYISKC